MKDWIEFHIGIYGEFLGLILIGLVSFWDFMVVGAKGFLEYSVCWKGVLIIWIGLALIVASKHLGRKK